jgi:hypothetical protein
MSRKHFIVCTQVSVCGAAIFLSAASAQGEPRHREDSACAAAYKAAEAREASGLLIEAKVALRQCAQPSCGGFLAQECTTKYTQLEADVPSVVPLVNDIAGSPRPDVEVRIDGALVASRLDGRALPVNPGLREITFASDGRIFATQQIIAVQGQRNRTIAVVFHPVPPKPDPEQSSEAASDEEPTPARALHPSSAAASAASAPAEPHPRRSHALSYTLASVGLVGLSGYALLTYWGAKDNSLLARCSPSCPQASVDQVRSRYLAADISLGVGIAALGAAIWSIAAQRSAGESEQQSPQQALVLGVQPTPSGAFATASRSF